MKILALIPARYASTRFPGKPLVEIKGKSMIQRVVEQSLKAFEYVYVATDDQRIFDHITELGYKAVMTSTHHKSGTDRCAEALKLVSDQLNIKFDIVVNVQGDEPFISPQQLRLLVKAFENQNTQIATLIKKIENEQELFDSNKPKVVTDINGKAIYFSRSVIPFCRNHDSKNWLKQHTYYKHIGLYAYRASILNEITQLKTSSLETCESLEQLRWIENGYYIQTIITDLETFSVDTPEDLKNILHQLHE
ncbi:MAG: 3-deoxy-manno-octulosonate cytidylyltransferase [Bacteroidales bacterium]|jgi:3-deoxy-manno-octulosonate cytidylyltransferase (CMP-KDO synthetase)|nr:3-deoxy-manno-octulosonate cytidylyltransferase [Bacteroidales bacterium]